MFSFPALRCRLSPLWIAGAVLVQPAGLLADELTAQKKTDIRRLMEVTGGDKKYTFKLIKK